MATPSGVEPVRVRRMRPQGVTLVELLVTLVIVVLVATLSIPAVNGALARAELRGTVAQLAGVLREARGRAVRHGAPVSVAVALGTRRFGIVGAHESHTFAADLAVRLVTADLGQGDAEVVEIRFFPDGTSTGGEITVTRGATHYLVRVEWLTGRVIVREGDDEAASRSAG
jgi:general secretion pathway protein H